MRFLTGSNKQKLFFVPNLTGNSWIVIFKRHILGKVNFARDWNDYKNGFGDPSGDYWIGLEQMHELTNFIPMQLRIEMYGWLYNETSTRNGYAAYTSFTIGPESDSYRLNVSGYTGDTGQDCFSSPVFKNLNNNGKMFSTPDHQNPNAGCASDVSFWLAATWPCSNSYFTNFVSLSSLPARFCGLISGYEALFLIQKMSWIIAPQGTEPAPNYIL